MRRKLLSAALAATMALTLAACGSEEQSADNPDAYTI
ncbi:MAG TPA: iron-siderophore ABC transporter substrate-binding protein, partial [Candidatus Scatomorpha intestinavium]|nr:iron-siderophore ABC transporter substrate-binding protein [Candidatus Scatomorpha intestinavium]